MPVTVTKNFGDLAAIPMTDRTLMREIGLLARERIIRRTLAGNDANEAAFAPYSKGYAADKAKALGSGHVNLQVSGRMLEGIVLDTITDDSVTLTFKD